MPEENVENVVHLHQRELEEREAKIEQAEKSYLVMGRELAAINTSRLYRDHYTTFEEYCEKRWEIARRTAYQFIDAAAFGEMCATAHIFIPAREKHIRPLLGLVDADRLTVWGGVLAQTGNDPKQVTEAIVKAAVARFVPTTPKTTKTGKIRKPRTPKMSTASTAGVAGTERATNPLGREPHAPGTTPHVATANKPEPAPEQPVTATGRPELLSRRKKQAAPKTDLVRDAVRELLLAGKTINREEIAAQYKSSEKAVQLAHCSELGRIEGFAEGHAAGIEAAIADSSILSVSAQQKLDAHIARETRRLAAEHAARMAQIDEDVRQRVVSEGRAYGEEMLTLSKKARRTEAQWRSLINRHHHLFTAEQYTAILRCLHPDSRDAVSPERLGTAFNLFKEKKFLMTGEED
jgi:predicted HAD superfamily Cof-like phosphohydrolase